MEIRVTQDHIDSGAPDSCFECPVALALIDAGVEGVEVNHMQINYVRDGRSITTETPEVITGFIYDFDDERTRHECRPFEFELAVD